MAIEGLHGAFQLSRRGVVVAEGAAGPASHTTTRSCTVGTRFQASSISKQLIAASMVLLQERGVLDLQDRIERWWAAAPGAWDQMTVEQLLTHTSGLMHWSAIPGLDILHPPTPAELLREVVRLPLVGTPGTTWSYSGVGYLLAAAIIELASDRSYTQFVTENVLRPLAMNETTSGESPACHQRAEGYRDGHPVPLVKELTSWPGTGDLWTTPRDLVRYANALRNGELLSRSSVQLMASRHSVLASGADEDDNDTIRAIGYGYGMFLATIAGRPAWVHPGDNPGYRSILAWLPEDEVSLALLSNDEATVLDTIVPRVLRAIYR